MVRIWDNNGRFLSSFSNDTFFNRIGLPIAFIKNGFLFDNTMRILGNVNNINPKYNVIKNRVLENQTFIGSYEGDSMIALLYFNYLNKNN